jgi:hypothetical protein
MQDVGRPRTEIDDPDAAPLNWSVGLVHHPGTMANDLEILFEEPDFTAGLYQNALLWAFRGVVSLPRIKWAIPAHKQLLRKYPKGIAVVTIITETASLSMPADARDLSTAITKENENSYCCVCEIIPGTGFRGAVARSVTAGIRLVARTKFPAKVFADAADASRWLAPLMSPNLARGIDPNALARAAERVQLGEVYAQASGAP